MVDSPSHMVAPFLQLYHCRTVVASLPTSLLGYLHKLLCLFILRTVLPDMPLAIAKTAYLSLTPTAFPVPPSASRTSRGVCVDVCWFDPLTAALTRTVDPILSGKFLVFLVPQVLEFVTEEPIDML